MTAPDVRSPRPRGPAPAPPVRATFGAPEPPVLSRDAQIGHIFRNMRAAMRLPREAIARRLATTPGTIEDLENGAVASLPHWRETVRIVRSYCEILRLDPEPLLWRIHTQLQATNAQQADPSTRSNETRPGPPPALLRKDEPKARPSGERRGRRRARTMFAVSAPLVLAAAAFYFAQAAPAPIYRTIAMLPGPLASGARSVMDGILLFSAPRREGLRWIDVGDPKLRKVDKLQTSSQ
jgi:transcriptional regulator with XRE-family HTH domain